MTNDWIKTGIFAATGVALAIIAATVYYSNLPNTDVISQRVGQPFFEEFEDVGQAKEIRIANAPESGNDRSIVLEYKNGLWRIPSHENYPAENSERLGDTVAILLGLSRQAIVSRETSNHAKYKVEDPLDKDANSKNSGTRLTVWDGTKNVLADLIIGKKVEVDSDASAVVNENLSVNDQYYVRHPNENEIYQVTIEPDLSSEFSEWISPNLLQVDETNLKTIEFVNYQIKPEVVTIDNRQYGLYLKDQIESQQVSRDQTNNQWTYDGINPETEQPNSTGIQAVVDTITQLEIVDVRRKFEYEGKLVLNPQLEIDRINPQLLDIAQEDLQKHGFAVINADRSGEKFTIASITKRGEITAETQEGVRYIVYSGEEFVGGINKTDADQKETEKAQTEEQDNPSKETADENKDSKTGPNLNRYVMIRVEYDPSIVGPPPTIPRQPNPPQKPKSLEGQDTFNRQASDLPPIPLGTPRVTPFDVMSRLYEKEYAEYQAKLEEVDTKTVELAEYNKRIENGKKKVAELNERFGSWFYVVKADKLKELKFNRESLVSAKVENPNSLPPVQGLNQRPNLEFTPEMLKQLQGQGGMENSGQQQNK